MVPKIVFHSRENNRTTTVKTERETIAENKSYELVGPSSTFLTENTVYEELSKVKTPFLLGVPRIVTPLKDQVVTDPEFKYFEISEAIFSDEFIGNITHVEWQIARDDEFKETIYNRIIEYKDEEDRKIPANDINLVSLIGLGYVRARYLSNKISSPYTQPLRFKVANKVINQPKVSVYGKGINIEFRVSDFSINNENGNDMYSASLYRLFKIPKEDIEFVPSYYEIDNKYLLSEFIKKATDVESNIVKFPAILNNQEVKLVAGEHIYVLQVRHKGKIYTSEIGYGYVDASGLRVDKPALKILDNELNPKIDISKFSVTNGEDEFSKYYITIYEVNNKERIERIIHEKETIYNQYVIPTGVCKSLHTYKVKVIAYGTNYMESEPAEIQFSLKEIGIKTPRINLQNLGMEPKFTVDQFELINCKDIWVGTEWELYIHGQLIDNNLNPITSLMKVYWTEAEKTSLQLLKTELEPNTNYIMKVRFVGEKYKSNWTVLEFKSTELDIVKPTLYVKLEGLNFTFDVSEYIVRGATDTPKEVWYYVAELDTSNIEEEKYIPIGEPFKVPYYKKALSINKKNGIKKDTKYKLVAKIIGEYFSTPFSEPVYMTTENIYVKPPTVTITGYPDRVPKRPTITTSPFEVTADNDIHVSTTYILQEKTADGLVDILRSENNTKNLTSLIILDDILKVKTEYLLTVIHYGEDYGASDPVTISFRTRNNFMYIPMDGEDGMQEIIIGSDEDQYSPKYFGKIPYEKLNNDRNYLGDWDGTKIYKAGEQVYYNNKLWYSLVDHNENRIPGIPTQEGIHYWKEDHRQELPTYKWVMEHIGFPVGVKCSIDGLSEGYEYVGVYRDNVNSDVLKIAFEGRILYIYDKVELENICYNDLVRMNIHGTRSRTIRISDRLYYVRTLTSREYIELRKLKKLDTENIIDLELTKQSFVSDTDQVDSRARLVNNEFYKTEEHSATVRDMGYRLVLEYIPEEEEPWRYYKNAYPDMIYDKYTDTGYFGSIEGIKFNIYNELGIHTGTKINKDVGYLGFYYHGKRLLVNRMPIVFGIGYRDLYDLGVTYDKDIVAPEDYKQAYVSNLILPDGRISVYSARIMKGGAFAYDSLGIVEDNEVKASDNMCRYSEWNELLYRVSQFEPKHVDRLYSHGGYQIGSNWDKFDNINLGVFEHYSGNGCHVYVDGVVDNKYILSRGGVRLEAVHWIEKKDVRNDYGLRLVLEDLESYIPKEYIPINKPKPDLPWTPINPDTIIKSDPLDDYPLLSVRFFKSGVDENYNVYRCDYDKLEKSNNSSFRYEETEHNKLLSHPSSLGNQLLLLCNGSYYVIEKIKYVSSRHDSYTIINNIEYPTKDNGYIFYINDGIGCLHWAFASRPTLRYFNSPGMVGMVDDIPSDPDYTFERCALYFGVDQDIPVICLGKKLHSKMQKDEFLLSKIDKDGNGDRIQNYTYEVIEVNTAKAELYEGYNLNVPVNGYNEITYFNIVSETMSPDVSIKDYDGKMDKIDDDYKAIVSPDTLIEKLTDEDLLFKTESRSFRLENVVNYDLETKTFIKINNNEDIIVPVEYITTNSSGNGSYTISTIFEHPDSPYKKDNSYILPNNLSVTRVGDVLYLYEGYRENGLNSDVNDLFIDLKLLNPISSTAESKVLYLEENNATKIKLLSIKLSDENLDIRNLEEGTIYQVGSINILKQDKDNLINNKNWLISKSAVPYFEGDQEYFGWMFPYDKKDEVTKELINYKDNILELEPLKNYLYSTNELNIDISDVKYNKNKNTVYCVVIGWNDEDSFSVITNRSESKTSTDGQQVLVSSYLTFKDFLEYQASDERYKELFSMYCDGEYGNYYIPNRPSIVCIEKTYYLITGIEPDDMVLQFKSSPEEKGIYKDNELVSDENLYQYLNKDKDEIVMISLNLADSFEPGFFDKTDEMFSLFREVYDARVIVKSKEELERYLGINTPEVIPDENDNTIIDITPSEPEEPVITEPVLPNEEIEPKTLNPEDIIVTVEKDNV